VPAPGRPTILLVAQQGFAARYLLRTGIFRTLRAAGARLVVLVPNADEPYLRAELGPDVAVEPLRVPPNAPARSRAWTLAYTLRNYTLGHGERSEALQSKYQGFRRRVRGAQRPVVWGVDVALRALWRSARLRRALLAAERRVGTPDLHGDVLDRHRPDLVVAASPGWFLADGVVLREAQRRGIRCAGVVAAWDNPTSKGYRGADPQLVAAWSDVMAEQLVQFHDVPRERILVGGVPHFDRYVAPAALWEREELCARTGLDPERRIVIYATSTPGLYAHNLDVAAGLAAAIADGRLGDAQLVVRLHPIFFRAGETASVEGFRALAAAHPHVHLDVPEVQSDVLRCDLRDSDNVRFSSLLKHADALACVFSTTTLEAFLVDCPVVFASWTAHLDAAPGADGGPVGDHQRAWDEFAHLREMVQAGAVRVGRSMPELVGHVRAYLDDPSLEREARLRFAQRECGPTDGHAGERVGRALLDLAA
jgi:hypothetical protein